MCQRASAAPEARAAYGRMACMAAQFGEPLLLSHVREPSQGPTTTRLPSQPPTPKPQQQEDTGGAPFFSSKRRRRRCEYSVPSDVFTLTALLDVLGRAHNATGAFWVFRRVRHPTAHGALRLQPNVGTSRACLLPCLFVCLFVLFHFHFRSATFSVNNHLSLTTDYLIDWYLLLPVFFSSVGRLQ